jgi:hypothetical protein
LRPLPHPWHPLTLGTLAAPIYLATPAGPRARTGQREMVNPVFVTSHSPTSSACYLASDADPQRCASEERHWRYRTALRQQGCRRHRAGDGLASRMARGWPVASAPPRSRANHGAPFSSRVIFERPWRCSRSCAHERYHGQRNAVQHTRPEFQRSGRRACRSSRAQPRELVHRWSMLSLSAAPASMHAAGF